MVEVERAGTRGSLATSCAYFNFLLNRSLNNDIELYQESPKVLLLSLDEVQAVAVLNREELEIVRKTQSLNNHLLGLQQGGASPDLFGAINYGFQGEEYSFSADDDFVFASLVLQWNLFHGMTNRNKIRQTKIEGEKLNEILSETEMKIRMQVISNYYSNIAAFEAISAAKKRVLSAQKAFRLIELKYSEGQTTLLESIDARTNYTNAEANLIIANCDYFISLAQLEFATASIVIEY
jgi:outer membrane protein TolC